MSIYQSKLLARIAGVEHQFLGPRCVPPRNMKHCQQVHGDLVVEIVERSTTELDDIKCDGILTRTKRCIGIQTADCLPVLFALKNGNAVAAVHAGWRGLHQGILLRTVEHFKRLNVKPQDLVVAIGPAIEQCCFEVSQDVIDAFRINWSALWNNRSAPWQPEQPMNSQRARTQAPIGSNNLWLDLDAIARMQLTSVGVLDEHIEDVGSCTYCGPGERASYRRSTHEKTKAGRQWSWIGRPEAI